MNKEKLLQMTSKEIEKFLNTSISSIAFESENSVAIKEKMIDMIKPLFDDSVEISNPYYDNREIGIILYDLYISFKVSTKKTEKTTQVTKLRKKYIRTIGTFKFNDIKLSFYNPNFDGLDLDNYIVKVSKNFCTGGASISLKHRKEKMIDILNKDLLWKEIESQDDDWKEIRKKVILNAAQPKIKKEYFNPGFNQEKWDYILLKTEEKNKELIDGEIEKMFKFDID
jgi:hypothetical protein